MLIAVWASWGWAVIVMSLDVDDSSVWTAGWVREQNHLIPR